MLVGEIRWTTVDHADWAAQEHSFPFTSVDEAVSKLVHIESTLAPEVPVLAQVIRANGDSLAIGLGNGILELDDDGADEEELQGLSVLNFVRSDESPPSYTSSGMLDAEGTIMFFYLGSPSEFELSAAVPKDAAIQAVRSFLGSEVLPDNIEWEED